ncbi:coiled-coil domain-containing protein 138-like [Dysidea avara]|uniref:coiled-coil domain-containing protein 138-like n=1 Tax=Dysidea avara TaxID=196820 RepID=UPI003332E39B
MALVKEFEKQLKRKTRGFKLDEIAHDSLTEDESSTLSDTSYSSGSSINDSNTENTVVDEPSIRENATHVYSELTAIRDKLHEESQRLQERETRLVEREQAILELEQLARSAHERLTEFAEEEVTRRWEQLEERVQGESQRLSEALKEKSKENRRLRSSFDSIKQASDSLRQQLEEVQQKNQKLEVDITSVQARLVNLQRKQQLQSTKHVTASIEAAVSQHSTKIAATSPVKLKEHRKPNKYPLGDDQYLELLAILLSWLCDDQLSKTSSPTQLLVSNSIKVLPIAASLIPNLHSASTQIQLPFIKFFYWTIVQLNSIGKQKSSLTTTLRRIGEELQKPSHIRSTEPAGVKPFYQSPDLHIRLLSSLVILQTISQVDCLALAFDMIKQDLRDDVGKEVFLLYHGVSAILCYLKPAHKVLCEHTADIFLLLSMDSITLQLFLNECSTDEWFICCAGLFRDVQHVGIKVLEKMSIVLQRLSKVKSNKRRFEQSQLIPVIQKLSRTLNEPDTAFLTLNLRSVLMNLNS